MAVVGGHVEGPQHLLDLEAGRVGGDQERGDAAAVACLAAGAGHDHVVLGLVDAGVPGLLAVDRPLVAVALGVGLHVGGVGAVVGLGDAEGEPLGALEHPLDPLLLLLGRAVVHHQQHADAVADDRVLGLQIVVEAEALGRQVLADDRHREIPALLAPHRLGQSEAVVPGLVGAAARLAHQLLPLLVGEAAAIPVGARVLAAVIEVADVVVLLARAA